MGADFCRVGGRVDYYGEGGKEGKEGMKEGEFLFVLIRRSFSLDG